MRTYILNATGADISPATIIICGVIAAICIFAVISYRKKLKNGCCGGGGDEVKHVKPQDTNVNDYDHVYRCLLYTSPSPRDGLLSRMPSSA